MRVRYAQFLRSLDSTGYPGVPSIVRLQAKLVGVGPLQIRFGG